MRNLAGDSVGDAQLNFIIVSVNEIKKNKAICGSLQKWDFLFLLQRSLITTPHASCCDSLTHFVQRKGQKMWDLRHEVFAIMWMN